MHDDPQDSDSGTAPAVDDVGWRVERDARERLQAIDDAPLEEHVAVYEDVHRRLQEGLADLDEG